MFSPADNSKADERTVYTLALGGTMRKMLADDSDRNFRNQSLLLRECTHGEARKGRKSFRLEKKNKRTPGLAVAPEPVRIVSYQITRWAVAPGFVIINL